MTMPESLNDTDREKADGEAVLCHAFDGEPLDPEVAADDFRIPVAKSFVYEGRERAAEVADERCLQVASLQELAGPYHRERQSLLGGRMWALPGDDT